MLGCQGRVTATRKPLKPKQIAAPRTETRRLDIASLWLSLRATARGDHPLPVCTAGLGLKSPRLHTADEDRSGPVRLATPVTAAMMTRTSTATTPMAAV